MYFTHGVALHTKTNSNELSCEYRNESKYNIIDFPRKIPQMNQVKCTKMDFPLNTEMDHTKWTEMAFPEKTKITEIHQNMQKKNYASWHQV